MHNQYIFVISYVASQHVQKLVSQHIYIYNPYAVGGQHHAPAALSLGMTRYPLYRRVGGARGRSGQVQKICPHRDSIPGPSSSQRVDISATLTKIIVIIFKIYIFFLNNKVH
jgi:hypothetical protein